uniref:Uncharacterized protein n=1 Tax=Scleropages formosus TaxID=113540 RepID=A0A8C9R558_SCLFO
MAWCTDKTICSTPVPSSEGEKRQRRTEAERPKNARSQSQSRFRSRARPQARGQRCQDRAKSPLNPFPVPPFPLPFLLPSEGINKPHVNGQRIAGTPSPATATAAPRITGCGHGGSVCRAPGPGRSPGRPHRLPCPVGDCAHPSPKDDPETFLEIFKCTVQACQWATEEWALQLTPPPHEGGPQGGVSSTSHGRRGLRCPPGGSDERVGLTTEDHHRLRSLRWDESAQPFLFPDRQDPDRTVEQVALEQFMAAILPHHGRQRRGVR